MNLIENFNVSKLTWFKTGGNCKYFLKANTKQDLLDFFDSYKGNYFILGNGSNTLIKDQTYNGCIVKLGKEFLNLDKNDKKIKVGAAYLNNKLVYECLKWELSGIEFLVSIPGTIGGGVFMNAGAMGFEICEYLENIEILMPNKKIENFTSKDLKMEYRSSKIPKGSIIISATFNLFKKNGDKIKEKINQSINHRATAQISGMTSGSTFKNPKGYKAWELIDKVGLRGYKIGGAMFSQKHCNFILNTGAATSTDIINLGKLAQKKVLEKFNIKLEWEIKII